MKQLMIKPTITSMIHVRNLQKNFISKKVILLSQTNISMSHSSGS